jgi:DNA-binding NtrC family response regulator
MQNPSIIIIDNDLNARETLEKVLKQEEYKVQVVSSCKDALDSIKSNNRQIVITELKLSDRSGLQVLTDIKSISAATPVLIISAHGTVKSAVKAMQRGAADFIPKPFSNESILLSVKKAVNRLRKNVLDNPKHEKALNLWKNKELVSKNSEIISLKKYAKSIANSNASVLIMGESGTGKELLAAYIVRYSGRDKHPYISMNCAALPDNLAESELFGYEKGAFTGAFQKRIGKFEQADRGTLLLDEISELSLSLQAKLLRVLQEKVVDRLGGSHQIPVDVRIISTCNVDLKKAVEGGRFRKDLFYRINVIPITIPPLRKRKEDIVLLSEYFIDKHRQYNNKKIDAISPDAIDYLCLHEWPGNVRELENVIERAVLIAEQKIILPEHIFIEKSSYFDNKEDDYSVGTTVKEMEKSLICKTLKHVNENRTHAAQLLGISIRTLRNKLREYQNENMQVDEPMVK